MSNNIDEKLKKKTTRTMKSKEMFLEELKQRMSQDEAEKIWRDAHKRLYKAYAEHTDLPKGVKSHTDSFIFPAGAIYLAMKEKDEAMAFEVMERRWRKNRKRWEPVLRKCASICGFGNSS